MSDAMAEEELIVGVGEPGKPEGDVGIVLRLDVARVARHRLPGAELVTVIGQRAAATMLGRADLAR